MVPILDVCIGDDHSPEDIPQNDCCREQPINEQQFFFLLCNWVLATTTFIPWDSLWAMATGWQPDFDFSELVRRTL